MPSGVTCCAYLKMCRKFQIQNINKLNFLAEIPNVTYLHLLRSAFYQSSHISERTIFFFNFNLMQRCVNVLSVRAIVFIKFLTSRYMRNLLEQTH